MRLRGLGVAAVILAALIPLGPVMLKGEVPSFRDHEDYFLPMRAFTAQALQSFELPLWNPYSASGEPWLANPQTGVFYPPAWLVAVLPFALGYVAFLSLHLVVLGLGLRSLFRVWGSDSAATLVSVALVVSGPILSLLDVSNNLATLAWIPWLLARALRRDVTPGVADTILLALSFLGGEPLLALVAWLAWTLLNVIKLGRPGWAAVAWRLVTATGLAAAQLLPFAELLVGSDRAAGLDPDVAFRNSLAVGDWLAIVVSPAGVQPGIAGSQLFLPSIYISPVIVFFALAAFARGGDRRWRLGWLVVLLVAVILASGSQFPLVGWVLEALMLTVNRYPVKFALFGVIALGALCAIGFDLLDKLGRRARIACGVAATVLMIGAQLAHRSAYAEVAVTGMIVGLLWLGGFIAILWFGRRLEDESRVLLVCALVPVIVFESLAASRFLLRSAPWPPQQPYSSVLDERYAVIRLEQLDAARAGDAHVHDRTAWMGGYLNLLARQRDASTAAPVIDRRYQSLHNLALTEPRQDVLDFLSVRYILTERDLSSFGYRLVAEHEGVAVFERPGARPMATLEFAPRVAPDEDEAYREVLKEGIARRAIAVGVDTDESWSVDGRGAVTNLQLSNEQVNVEVEVSSPALLVLNQTMKPGWIVEVDGTRQRPVTVNALFRGVKLDPGRHEVVWVYRPRSLRAGIFISIAAMCALAFEWRRVLGIRKKMSRPFHSGHA